MTANGSEYKDSRDEAVTLSYNSLQILTDPYQEDSFQVNGQSIAQWPRIIAIRNSVLSAITAAGAAIDVVWTAPVLPYFNSFANPPDPTKQPVLDYTDFITIPAPTHLAFPLGGEWLVHVDSLLTPGFMATGDQFAVKLAWSTNGGAGFSEVASNVVTQNDAGPLPDLNRCGCSWSFITTNLTNRIKLTVQGNFNGNISSTVTITRVR